MTIENDDIQGSELEQFLSDAFAAAASVMKDGAAFYIWHASSTVTEFISAAQSVGLTIKQQLIWVKNSIVLGRQDYQWKHEPCLYGWKEGAAHYFTDSRKESTVLEFDKPLANTEHPTMKPVKLFAYQMSNSTRKGDLVFDPFGGSGTTMIAAEQLGRRAALMELDPHYASVIVDRWEKFTGRTAEKIA